MRQTTICRQSALKIKNTILCVVLSLIMIAVSFMSVTFTDSGISYAARKTAKKPAKVKNLSVKVKEKAVNIKWQKTKYAKKYQVYVRSGSTGWKRYKTIKKTKTSYTAEKATVYSFRVRALNGKKKGSFSKTAKVKIASDPILEPNTNKVSTTVGGSFTVKFTGTAASGAIWDFDDEYLDADTDDGANKRFKAVQAGKTKILVSDPEDNKHIIINVTISEKKEQSSGNTEEDQKPPEKKFYLETPAEITVTRLDPVIIKVRGTDSEYPEWEYDKNIFLGSKYDKRENEGRDIEIAPFKIGDTTITVTSQSGISLTVHVHVNDIERTYKTIDGVKFQVYDEYDMGSSNAFIMTDKPIDPDKLKVVADFPNPVYLKSNDTKMKIYGLESLETLEYYTYPTRVVYDKDIGDIRTEIFGILENKWIEAIPGLAHALLDHNITLKTYSKLQPGDAHKKINISVYYNNELVQKMYNYFEPTYDFSEDYSLFLSWEKECWKEGMSDYEKLEAMCKYIADNFTYQQYDCRACSIIHYLAEKLGLITWTQGQESKFRTYESLDIYTNGTIGEHRVTVVVIDGKQIAFHTQGGGYSVSEIDPVTKYDRLFTKFCTVEYSHNPI